MSPDTVGRGLLEAHAWFPFTHMWTIRNRAQDHRGREGKLNGKKSERETNHERFFTLGNKQGCWRRVGEGMG